MIREIAGEENFLEHHSNVFSQLEDDEKESEKLSTYQMRTERWDVSVIATTLVQFLNALFDGKSSSVRRMHHLCRAVIMARIGAFEDEFLGSLTKASASQFPGRLIRRSMSLPLSRKNPASVLIVLRARMTVCRILLVVSGLSAPWKNTDAIEETC